MKIGAVFLWIATAAVVLAVVISFILTSGMQKLFRKWKTT